LSVACALPVAAQTYPTKPVRLVIPFPPGGPTDIVGRMVAQHLAETWKQQFIADNRPGAGGNIGVELASKAPPDGYTLSMFTVAQSIAPSVYRRLTFDPMKDLSLITLVALIPSVLVVHPSLPAKNVRELLVIARERPGALNYSSAGNGTSPHMLMELFLWRTQTRMVHIPYKGTSPALVDQMAGQVVAGFNAAAGVLPYVRQGRLRALAVSTKARFPAMPDLPTVAESGVPDFDGSSWQGLAAPAGTPNEVIQRVHAEIVRMLQDPAVRDRVVHTLGAIPVGNTPEEFNAFLRADAAQWAKVAAAARVTLD